MEASESGLVWEPLEEDVKSLELEDSKLLLSVSDVCILEAATIR
jgi:hypothetical protein